MKKNSGENMAYDVYLDLFLFHTFFMNSLVLISMVLIVGRKCSWKRILGSAMTGALLNTISLLWNREIPGLSLFTAGVMCRILFQKQETGKTIKYSFFLLFTAFCMEGALTFYPSFLTVIILPVISWLIGRERKKQSLHMKVLLRFKGRKKELNGFYDSGNRLVEPLTGKMVHIACYEEVKDILPESYCQAAEQYFQTGFLEDTKVTELQMYEFTFLSYHSIGKETGQLLGIRMDSAEFISSAGKKTEEKVVIGLANQRLFVKGHDRMIINGRLEL